MMAMPSPAGSPGGAPSATGEAAVRASGAPSPRVRRATAKKDRAAQEGGGGACAASTPGAGRPLHDPGRRSAATGRKG